MAGREAAANSRLALALDEPGLPTLVAIISLWIVILWKLCWDFFG
jgi:hypothetical protein